MKAEIPEVNLNVERLPTPIDITAENVVQSVGSEMITDSSAEHYEQKSEMNAIMSDVGLATAIPTPVINNPIVDENTTITDSPLIASDDDLIEKEWVEKAKKIVSDTKNDPYMREKKVSKLQNDYIYKRFGRKLGVID